MKQEVKSDLTQIIKRRELEAQFQISRSSIYERLDPKSKFYDPDFPKPVRLGTRSVGFVAKEAQAWLERRMACRTDTGSEVTK